MVQSNNTEQKTSNSDPKEKAKSGLKGLTSKKPKKDKKAKPAKAKDKAKAKAGAAKGPKGKGGKNKSLLSDKSTSKAAQLITKYYKDVIIGIILGVGTFYSLISQFGLRWSRKHWADGSFSGGLVKSWNILANKLASVDGVFLTKLLGEDESNGFFLTVIMLLIILISILVVLSKNKWAAIVYPLVVIIPTIIWGVSASVLGVCIMALGLMLLMVNSDISKVKMSYRNMIYALVIAFLAFAVISAPGVSKLADRTAKVDKIRTQTEQNLADKYYGENVLKDGNLRAKHRETGEGTALKVSMDAPQSMYLRGFVGDILGKDGWEPLSPATYYDQSNFVYWMNYNGFNGLGQLGQSSELAKQGGKKRLNPSYMESINSVSVENVGASTKYAYIPYEITIDGVEGTKNWGDSFLTGGKLKKVKEYDFTATENATKDWTENASKLFSNKVTPPEQYDYMENEAYFNQYVYDKFTYISDEDREILSYAMPGEGDQTRGHVEYNKAITSVKELINFNFTYAEDLEGYSKKVPVLRNIFDNLEGYDAQLATAAVMMFRYYGIPARYVEGYLITEDDVMYGDTEINVPRSNAHAWAEIYVDGMGFVPVEVCDEYAGLMPEADYTVGIKTKQQYENPDMSRVHDENPNVITEDAGSGSGKKMPNKAVYVVAALIGLLLLVLLAFLIRYLFKKIKAVRARNKLFKSGNPKEAVAAIYAYMESLGLDPDDETRRIGNIATYSAHNVSESDRILMLANIKKLKKKKKADKRLAKAKAKKAGKAAKAGKPDKAAKASKAGKFGKKAKAGKADKADKAVKGGKKAKADKTGKADKKAAKAEKAKEKAKAKAADKAKKSKFGKKKNQEGV